MSKKLGKAWRGTTREFKGSKRSRKGIPPYRRFSGFDSPIQPPGMPSGKCLGAHRGTGTEGCKCGKHNKGTKQQ